MSAPINRYLLAYIECALWSSVDAREEKDVPLDDVADVDDLAPETLEAMRADWTAFQDKADKQITAALMIDVELDLEQVAHDFWLTRNGHGAGFWDGDYPEPLGDELTEIAESFGHVDLYIGDDGKVYQS